MRKKVTLFLIIAILFLLLGYFFHVFLNSSKGKRVDELFGYAELTRNEFKNKPDYWGLENKLLIEKGLKNNEKENKIKNSFGKEVLIGNDFDGYKVMPGNRTFDIAYLKLNHQECIDLVTYKLQDKQKIYLVSVKIRTEGKTTEFSWGGENKLPISINSAKKVCNKNRTNDILWTFE